MFHHGEFGIFAKAGAAGVFYADALIGPRLPGLTAYVLSFPDVAALESRGAEVFGRSELEEALRRTEVLVNPPSVSQM